MPITVNYKGEDTYKTFLGFLCTFAVAFIMLWYTWLSFDQLINRTEPDRSSYKITSSRDSENAVNLPEVNSQLYFGLRETVEYSDGTRAFVFIDFDPTYINGKIDYYERRRLDARKNLELCGDDDREGFVSKVENTNGITEADFDKMRCIPAANF